MVATPSLCDSFIHYAMPVSRRFRLTLFHASGVVSVHQCSISLISGTRFAMACSFCLWPARLPRPQKVTKNQPKYNFHAERIRRSAQWLCDRPSTARRGRAAARCEICLFRFPRAKQDHSGRLGLALFHANLHPTTHNTGAQRGPRLRRSKASRQQLISSSKPGGFLQCL